MRVLRLGNTRWRSENAASNIVVEIKQHFEHNAEFETQVTLLGAESLFLKRAALREVALNSQDYKSPVGSGSHAQYSCIPFLRQKSASPSEHG
jgi:hypothetical protein